MNKKTLQFNITAAVIIFGIGSYQLRNISGMTMYPDEFGYWANAAYWLGFDWSEVVSLQSYYSFGYSLLLWPFLACMKNPALMYQAAVLLNIIIIFFHAVVLYQVAKELNEDGKKPQWLFCLMAACYPSLLFYMQFTMTESLLNLLFIVSIWLLVKYGKTQRMQYGIFFIITLVYSYFVHMRTVGILAAGSLALTVCVIQRNKEEKQQRRKLYAILTGIILGGILLVLLGNGIKEGLQTNLYQNTDPEFLKGNDYSGQIWKMKALFKAEGVKNFFISCIGKIFYLGVSTLGTFYFGIWHLIKHLRKRPIYLFILSAIVFTFGITAVYMLHGGRADTYLYGRYNEVFVSIVVYLGLHEMEKNRFTGRIVLLITVLQGGMAVLLTYWMKGADPGNYQGYFTVGFSYVLQEKMPGISDYVVYPYIAGSIITLLLALVTALFIRKKKILVWYLVLFIGLFGYTAVSAGSKYLYDHSMDTADDMELVEAVKERIQKDDTVVFLLSESDAHYVDIIQFCLREHPLRVVDEDSDELGKYGIVCITGSSEKMKEENKADFIFTYKNSKKEEILKQLYANEEETYHFKCYFH